MRRTVETDRFLVKGDGGRTYTIVQHQEFISAGTLPNPRAEVAGLKSWATSTGLTVDTIDRETFEIVETGERVRKV